MARVKQRIFRAPGKLFWIGEYAVLYGAPALVAAVDRYAIVSRVALETRQLIVGGSALESCVTVKDARGLMRPIDAPDAALVRAVVETLVERGERVAEGWTVFADSSALSVASGQRKLGLGSSAAVAAGLALALCERPPYDATTTAVAAHRRFQKGRGSGGDVLAALHGGLTVVRDGALERQIVPPSSLRWVAMDAGESASTRALMGRVAEARARDPERAEAVFSELDALARVGIGALADCDIDSWMLALRDYVAVERELAEWSGAPIFPASVERCLDAAAEAGAVAKPSGAGGGDIVLAFTRTEEGERRIRSVCKSRGISTLDLALAPSGALAPPD